MASILSSKKPGPRAVPITPPDWQALRREFPTTEKFTYLDIARKAILPRRVEEAMREWFADIYHYAGADAFSMDCIEQTRTKVAEVFGASPENIALIKNTSEGINIVAQGYPLEAGDNVLISKFEHENNTFPWRHLDAKGIEIRWAEPDAQGRVTVDCYRELVDKRTRILGAAWVAYGNGYRADVPTLAEFCHTHGIKLVIDAIQAVGVLATSLADLGADVIVAGGHKAQFSLAGAGFMYITEEMAQCITPPYAAKFSFTSNDRMQERPDLAPDAHRFEYGNPNFLGIWVQGRSAEYLQEIGLGNIEARVRELSTYLMERATELGIKVKTPRPWHERAGIVSFNLPGDAGENVVRLRAKNIVCSVKDGLVRAAVHFYNTEEELERFIAEITPA
ncbi:MAG: cysteine desulfurase [Gammaproteobacteria bacterium]|nr:MAG: cysteine desulfurase [Gammaproteobacteria bacterium]